MKRTVLKVALLGVLATMAASCQKETFNEGTSIAAENSAVYKIHYSIDGVTHQVTLLGDEAWHDFLNRMISMAEQGHKVSFRLQNTFSQITYTKDVVTYSTTDHDDAYKWADIIGKKGYSVTIEYDERTGIYTCTAIK